MTTYISQRTGLFGHFDRQLGNPDWTGRHLTALFPRVRIRPPLPPERQHCAVLHKRTGTGR